MKCQEQLEGVPKQSLEHLEALFAITRSANAITQSHNRSNHHFKRNKIKGKYLRYLATVVWKMQIRSTVWGPWVLADLSFVALPPCQGTTRILSQAAQFQCVRRQCAKLQRQKRNEVDMKWKAETHTESMIRYRSTLVDYQSQLEPQF